MCEQQTFRFILKRVNNSLYNIKSEIKYKMKSIYVNIQ